MIACASFSPLGVCRADEVSPIVNHVNWNLVEEVSNESSRLKHTFDCWPGRRRTTDRISGVTVAVIVLLVREGRRRDGGHPVGVGVGMAPSPL